MEAVGTVEQYIGQFPADIRKILQQIRETIRMPAPEAVETISYGMPTFVLSGNLVHFAAFSRHIGFYPVPSGIDAFRDRLAGYKGGKGSVRFPLDEPMPLELIGDIVRFRVQENLSKAEKKKVLRTCPNGHRYFRTAERGTCPECEASEEGPGFLGLLAAPARQALFSQGIATADQLARFSEPELLKLHGIGRTAIPILRKALADQGLAFRTD